MEDTKEMVLNIMPVPKGRPRYANGHAYTPKRTREYEDLIRMSWRHGMLEGPLFVEMFFNFPIPKRGTPLMVGQPHLKRPDLDNLVKAVLDGLQGKAFKDDSEICMINASKTYNTDPYVAVRITYNNKEQNE
jgi:Holliday junction resolvase RusA-like endonuclease